MVVGVNMSNISTTHNSGKRKKKIEHSEVRDEKKSRRSSEIVAYLFLHWDQLVDNVWIKSDSTSSSRDKKRCSIGEVMIEPLTIDGITINDYFISFSIEYFYLRKNKDMWASIGILIRCLNGYQECLSKV